MHVLGLVLVFFGLFFLMGCAEEETVIHLETLEAPPGGVVATVLTVSGEERSLVLAPSRNQLFLREAGSELWESRQASWPLWVEDPGLDFFSLVQDATNNGDFSPRRYFTYFQGALWTITVPAAGRRPLIMRSNDHGMSWIEVPVPDTPEGERTVQLGSSVPVTWRLHPEGENLYLVDGRRIWQFQVDDSREEGQGEENSTVIPVSGEESQFWRPLRLAGISLIGRDTERESGLPIQALPRRIRHYLPAEGDLPEFVTVYGARLNIYRRSAGEEEFQRLDSLDLVDRDFLRSPDGSSLYLLDHRGLYRSEDQGDSWIRLEITAEETSLVLRQRFSQVVIRALDESSAGYRIWVMGATGSLFWSDDGGQSWSPSFGRDEDGRAVTGIAFFQDTEEIWAATSGRGLWRSFDGGQSWTEGNQGLSAGRIFDVRLLNNREALVGTDGGLFRHRNLEEQEWESITGRATTTMLLPNEERNLLLGTLGGSVVLWDYSQEEEITETAPIGGGEQVQFSELERNMRGLRPEAVVALRARRGTPNLYAWSHQQGPLVSNDRGESWRRMRLGAAFRTAMMGSMITDFLTTEEGSLFAVTASRTPNQPTQLWRSSDGGQTWVAVYSSMETGQEYSLRLLELPGNAGLVKAHGSRFSLSDDQGDTWTSLRGPWERGYITGMGLHGERVVLIVQLPHSSEAIWVGNITEGTSIRARHLLDWPSNWRLTGTQPLGVDVVEERILLTTRDAHYVGIVPRRQTRLPWSLTLLATLAAILMLSAIGFASLRRLT